MLVSLQPCDEFWLRTTMIRCTVFLLISHQLHTNRRKIYVSVLSFRNWFMRVFLHPCDEFWMRTTMVRCTAILLISHHLQNKEGKNKMVYP
jgi:hypothetical protein